MYIVTLFSVNVGFFCNPQLKNDEGFQEFLAVHKNRTQVPTWANDAVEAGTVEKSKEIEKKKEKKAASDDYLNFDSDDSEDLSEDEEQGASEDEDEQGVSLFLSYIKDRLHINVSNLHCVKKRKALSPTTLMVHLDTQFNNDGEYTEILI